VGKGSILPTGYELDQPIFGREMLGIRFLKGTRLLVKMEMVFRFYAVLKTTVKMGR